jgi:DNA-binding NtrC family response regulator
LSAANKKILLVEDELVIQKLCVRLLIQQGYQLVLAATVEEGIQKMQAGKIDLLISDLKLPDGNGLDVVRIFKERFPASQVLVITGASEEDEIIKELKASIDCEYLSKPFDIVRFISVVSKALHN